MIINFKKTVTDLFLKKLLIKISKEGLNNEIYADIAYLFTTDISKLSEKILLKILDYFIKFNESPIYVPEIHFFLQKHNKSKDLIYGKSFENFYGTEEIFNIEVKSPNFNYKITDDKINNKITDDKINNKITDDKITDDKINKKINKKNKIKKIKIEAKETAIKNQKNKIEKLKNKRENYELVEKMIKKSNF